MAPRNHAACVGSYCDAILSGEIIAGRYVELAVRRYLDDLDHAHERGLYFDEVTPGLKELRRLLKSPCGDCEPSLFRGFWNVADPPNALRWDYPDATTNRSHNRVWNPAVEKCALRIVGDPGVPARDVGEIKEAVGFSRCSLTHVGIEVRAIQSAMNMAVFIPAGNIIPPGKFELSLAYKLGPLTTNFLNRIGDSFAFECSDEAILRIAVRKKTGTHFLSA